MAKSVKRILVLAVIFTMTIVNYGLPLQAIAAESGSLFNFSFFRRNEIALDAYFGEDSEKTEEIKNVNDTAMITLEVSPLIEGYLKSGSLKFNLKNGNENNFKLISATMEEKEELELDDVDAQMIEEAKDSKNENVVEETVSEEIETPKEEVKEEKVEEDKEEASENKEEPKAESENSKNSLMDILKGSGIEEIANEVANKASTTNEVEKEVKEEPEKEDVVETIPDVLEEVEEIDIMEEARKCYEVSLASENEIALKNIIDSTKIFVEVAYNQAEKINVKDLFSEIEIVLEGNYINKKLETLEVIRRQDIILGWEYSKEVKVTSEIAKVSPFTVGKNAGTIIENIVTVKRDIEEDKFLPIKQTNIKIEIPKINDKLPIAVNVAANKLMATLGKELTGKEFTKHNWNYDEETGILEIQVVNSEMLLGHGEDKFDIICRYEDYFEEEVISLDKKVFVQVEEFSANENVIQDLELIETEEKEVVAGELMSYATLENEETIGKGKINANYHIETGDTRFSSRINVTVLTSDILDEVLIEPTKEVYRNKDGVEFEATPDVKYAGVKFNLAEIKDMLVQGTTIDLLDGEGNVFHTITKDVDATKIEFASQIDNVKVRINDVKVNGNLSIEFVKVINRSQYSQAEFAGFEKIENSYKAEVKYVGFEDTFQLQEIKDEIKFANTVSQVNLLVNKSQLSTVYENENVEFKIDLINNFETSDIYKNPSFELVFPVFVKEVKVNNIYTVYQNGLTIRDHQVVNENGKNKIIINLDGVQNGFNFSDITNGTNIIVNTNLVLDEVTPQKQDQVELFYCNEAVTNYQTQANWNMSRIVPEGVVTDKCGYDATTVIYDGPNGMIAVNAIKNYDGNGNTIKSFNQGEIIKVVPIKGETQVATMELTVVNNTGNECIDTVLLGRIPFKGNTDVETGEDLGTNVDTIMKSPIIPAEYNSNSGTIYYSTNPNADKDLNNTANAWNTEYLGDTTKSFMIVVDGNISHGGILKYTYDFEIPANLGYEVGIAGSFGAFYHEKSADFVKYETAIADKVGIMTESGVKLNATLSVDVGDGAEIAETRYFKYTVKVENTGSIDLKNVTVEVVRPSFTWLCELSGDFDGGNDGYERTSLNKAFGNIPELKAGESAEKTFVFKAEEIPENFEDYYVTIEKLQYDPETDQYYLLNENNEMEYITEIPEELFIEGYATVYVDGTVKGFETNRVKNKLVPANFDITTTVNNVMTTLEPEMEYQYVIDVTNISGNTLENIKIEDVLPKEVTFIELDERFDTCEYEFDEKSNKLELNLGTLENKERFRAYATCKIDDFKNIGKANIGNKFIVKSGDIEEHSSLIEREFTGAELFVTQETNLVGNEVPEYEEFELVVNVKNKGYANSKEINFELDIPEDIEIINLTSESKYPIPTKVEGRHVSGMISALEPNDEVSFILVLRSKPLAESETNRIFNINSKVSESYIGELAMNSLVLTVLDNPNRELTEEEKKAEDEKITVVNPEAGDDYKEDIENSKNNTNNSNNNKPAINNNNNNLGTSTPIENNNSVEKIRTYRITGKVWEDVNKNNAKDSNEEGVGKVQVSLYKGNSKLKSVVTDSLGKYRFTEIEPGSYTVAFEYDGKEYMAAKYKLANVVESENSDAIESEEGLAVTDIINIADKDVEINLGLQDRDILDFAVQKYITKAIVTTKGKEKVENYDSQELAKLEIRSKELKNTSIALEYKIVVTNMGTVSGKVGSVYDYLPASLSFNEKGNDGWEMQGKDVLVNETLKDTVIKAGESKELKLVLTKKMTEDNTGTISNKVQIAEVSSDKGSNENIENNIATQEIIITISTGRTVSRVLFVTILIVTTIVIYGIRTGKIKRKYK